MPVCSICEDNKPKSGYSNKQIKNKGKRRCKECVALTEEEIVTRYGELKDGKRVKLQGDLENTHTLTQHKGNDKEIVNEYEFKSKVDAFGLAAKARGTVLDMEALSLETIAGVGGYQALRYGMLLQRRKNLYTLDEKLTNPLDIAKKFAPNKTNQVRMRANRTPSLEEMLATGDSYMTGFHGAQRDPNYACQLYFGSAWGDEVSVHVCF